MKDKAYRVAGFLLLSSVLLFVGACASEKPCTIQGTVTVPDPDQTYYVRGTKRNVKMSGTGK